MKKHFIIVLFILYCLCLNAQDFLSASWKEVTSDLTKNTNLGIHEISKLSLSAGNTDNQIVQFPLKKGDDELTMFGSQQVFLNQNIDAFYTYVNGMFFYGIMHLKYTQDNERNVYDYLFSNYNNPIKTTKSKQIIKTFLNETDVANYAYILAEDIYTFQQNGESLLGELLSDIDSNSPESTFYAFSDVRSKIYMLSNIIEGSIFLIFSENISMLQGMYSSEYSHVIIADNRLYYFIYNPNYNDFSYVADVYEYDLKKLKVYQYKRRDAPGFLFLNIDGFNESFVSDNYTAAQAKKKIMEILEFNKSVDNNNATRKSQRIIIE